jgi:hypothetical protein
VCCAYGTFGDSVKKCSPPSHFAGDVAELVPLLLGLFVTSLVALIGYLEVCLVWLGK